MSSSTSSLQEVLPELINEQVKLVGLVLIIPPSKWPTGQTMQAFNQPEDKHCVGENGALS